MYSAKAGPLGLKLWTIVHNLGDLAISMPHLVPHPPHRPHFRGCPLPTPRTGSFNVPLLSLFILVINFSVTPGAAWGLGLSCACIPSFSSVSQDICSGSPYRPQEKGSRGHCGPQTARQGKQDKPRQQHAEKALLGIRALKVRKGERGNSVCSTQLSGAPRR